MEKVGFQSGTLLTLYGPINLFIRNVLCSAYLNWQIHLNAIGSSRLNKSTNNTSINLQQRNLNITPNTFNTLASMPPPAFATN